LTSHFAVISGAGPVVAGEAQIFDDDTVTYSITFLDGPAGAGAMASLMYDCRLGESAVIHGLEENVIDS
jgi:hypothetical protein